MSNKTLTSERYASGRFRYQKVKEIGDRVLVSATAGAALGVITGSVLLGGIGVALGAGLGLIISLREPS